MFIGQPAEERVDGTRAMLAGNLRTRFRQAGLRARAP